MLSVQAENAASTSGSGWSTERSLNGFTGSGYIVWRGNDDFRVTDQNPPNGIKAYDFTVTTPGVYEFTAQVQARVGNGSAANDKDNDAWVKFNSGSRVANVDGDASKWTKFFVSGSDESWKNYSRGEQFDPKLFTDIQRTLPAGRHRILVGGRSARFAIDRVGLQLIRATGSSVPTVTPDPQPPVSPPTVPSSPVNPVTPAGACSATGNSLQQAKNNFAANCPRIEREDCDPTGGGNWICSSGNIGAGSSNVPSTPTPTPSPVQPPSTPSTPTSGAACSASGSSLQQAKSNFANNCPTIARDDCDPIGGGDWVCSSESIGSGVQATGITRTSLPSQPTPTGTIGRFSRGDLLVLNYDNCPDRDDGHAIVAGKAVIDTVGISNFMVVNGTCGADIFDDYQPESEAVMNATYGNNWLDWFNNQRSVVATSADRWAATLANGDEVWVAEGGPSDFTADVLRRISDVYPSVDRKRIHVIQHSATFNQRSTSDAGLDLVRSVTDYQIIGDGNSGNNGSADFSQKSSFFVSTARASRYAREWDAAFNYLNPDVKLDFSDTVELLYIINDTRTQTVDDFANNYLR